MDRIDHCDVIITSSLLGPNVSETALFKYSMLATPKGFRGISSTYVIETLIHGYATCV